MATNQLLAEAEAEAARRPGIGHNKPPLGEELDEILRPWLLQRDEILETCGKAVIIDDESAGKVADLMKKGRSLLRDANADRETKNRPYLDATRLINGRFGTVTAPIILAMEGDGRRVKGLRGMLTEYENRRRREAEEARQRLLAEQRQREREAEEARQAAERAEAAGRTSVVGQMAAAERRHEAVDLGRRAEAVFAPPIRTQASSIGTRREIGFEITDLPKLLAWALTQPLRHNVEQAARTIVGSYLRGLGVEACARGVEIPGLTVEVKNVAAVR